MKKTLLLIGVIAIGLGSVALYFHSFEFPYRYYKAIDKEEGFKDASLTIDPSKTMYINPPQYSYIGDDKAYSEDTKSKWEKMHFSNLRLPLPVKHPMISIQPWILKERGKIKLGIKMLDFRKKEQFSFIQDSQMSLNFRPVENALFNNPAFRRYLKTKSTETIWKDVIDKDLRLNLDKEESYFSKINLLLSLSTQKLIYNLYILSLRKRLFPDEENIFGIDKESGFFIVRKKEKRETPIVEELVYVHYEGKILMILFRSNPYENLSQSIRRNILTHMTFDKSDKDSSKFLMGEFKNLSFREKSSEHGLLYLLSGWSHELDNKNFVKFTIRTLERGDNNLEYLMPLYDYSYKKFKSNFSSIPARLKEDKSEEQKVLSESTSQKVFRNEVKSESQDLLNLEDKTKDEALEEVIKRKINIDDQEDSLSID